MAGDFEEPVELVNHEIPRIEIETVMPPDPIKNLLERWEDGPGCRFLEQPNQPTLIPDLASLKNGWMSQTFNSEEKIADFAIKGTIRYLTEPQILDKFGDNGADREKWRDSWWNSEADHLKREAAFFFRDNNQMRPNRMTMALGYLVILGNAAKNQVMGGKMAEDSKKLIDEIADNYSELSISERVALVERVKKHIICSLDTVYSAACDRLSR